MTPTDASEPFSPSQSCYMLAPESSVSPIITAPMDDPSRPTDSGDPGDPDVRGNHGHPDPPGVHDIHMTSSLLASASSPLAPLPAVPHRPSSAHGHTAEAVMTNPGGSDDSDVESRVSSERINRIGQDDQSGFTPDDDDDGGHGGGDGDRVAVDHGDADHNLNNIITNDDDDDDDDDGSMNADPPATYVQAASEFIHPAYGFRGAAMALATASGAAPGAAAPPLAHSAAHPVASAAGALPPPAVAATEAAGTPMHNAAVMAAYAPLQRRRPTAHLQDLSQAPAFVASVSPLESNDDLPFAQPQLASSISRPTGVHAAAAGPFGTAAAAPAAATAAAAAAASAGHPSSMTRLSPSTPSGSFANTLSSPRGTHRPRYDAAPTSGMNAHGGSQPLPRLPGRIRDAGAPRPSFHGAPAPPPPPAAPIIGTAPMHPALMGPPPPVPGTAGPGWPNRFGVGVGGAGASHLGRQGFGRMSSSALVGHAASLGLGSSISSHSGGGGYDGTSQQGRLGTMRLAHGLAAGAPRVDDPATRMMPTYEPPSVPDDSDDSDRDIDDPDAERQPLTTPQLTSVHDLRAAADGGDSVHGDDDDDDDTPEPPSAFLASESEHAARHLMYAPMGGVGVGAGGSSTASIRGAHGPGVSPLHGSGHTADPSSGLSHGARWGFNANHPTPASSLQPLLGSHGHSTHPAGTAAGTATAMTASLLSRAKQSVSAMFGSRASTGSGYGSHADGLAGWNGSGIIEPKYTQTLPAVDGHRVVHDPDAPKRRQRALAMWHGIDDLDAFLKDVYHYYHEGGFFCMTLTRVTNLLVVAFTIGFSTFLMYCIDWPLLHRSKEHRLDSVIVSRCVASLPWLPLAALLVAVAWWTADVAQLVLLQIPRWLALHDFYRDALHIPEEDLVNMAWHDVTTRLSQLATTAAPGKTSAPLDAYLIAHRILRHDNYLIALLNRDLLELRPPFVIGKAVPPMLTKVLEWNLRFCLLQFCFGPGGHLRREFLRKEQRARLASQLRARFKLVALINLAVAPFLLVFLLFYTFFRYAEEFHKSPSHIGHRGWTAFAKWKFRELNELPHTFDRRLTKSHVLASQYLSQFPNLPLNIVARFVAFVTGSFAAVLAIMVLLDQDLLAVEVTPDRTILFYIGVFGSIQAVARGLFPEEEHVPLDPATSLQLLIDETHYMPPHWRNRFHASDVRREVARLFDYKIMLFLNELLSVLVAPLILYFSLPDCSERIIDFFREYTVRVSHLGYVCSLADFDYRRTTPPPRRAAARHASSSSSTSSSRPHPPPPPPPGDDDALYSHDAKMAMSFMNFRQQHPEFVSSQRAEMSASISRLPVPAMRTGSAGPSPLGAHAAAAAAAPMAAYPLGSMGLAASLNAGSMPMPRTPDAGTMGASATRPFGPNGATQPSPMASSFYPAASMYAGAHDPNGVPDGRLELRPTFFNLLCAISDHMQQPLL